LIAHLSDPGTPNITELTQQKETRPQPPPPLKKPKNNQEV